MLHNGLDLKRTAKAFLPQSLIEKGATAMFLAKKQFSGFAGAEVPDDPHFDDQSTTYFLDKLDQCTFYLEYGTGGSTIQAARKGKPFIAVDSDMDFVNAVKKKIGKLGSDQNLINIDIGVTGLWGVPVFKKPTKSRLAKWRRYPSLPWTLITAQRVPDLILVDGRFRVSCALTCIKNMRDRSNFTLLIDDYKERPNYHIVERFAQLNALVGRMAVFNKASFNANDLDQELQSHSSDWR